jgi:hypothetical protein
MDQYGESFAAVRVDPEVAGACEECEEPATIGWLSSTGRLGRCYCGEHAPERLRRQIESTGHGEPLRFS